MINTRESHKDRVTRMIEGAISDARKATKTKIWTEWTRVFDLSNKDPLLVTDEQVVLINKECPESLQQSFIELWQHREKERLWNSTCDGALAGDLSAQFKLIELAQEYGVAYWRGIFYVFKEGTKLVRTQALARLMQQAPDEVVEYYLREYLWDQDNKLAIRILVCLQHEDMWSEGLYRLAQKLFHGYDLTMEKARELGINYAHPIHQKMKALKHH